MFKETLSKIFKVDSLLSNLTGYVETRVELLKVEVKEDLSKGLAQAIAYLFIFFVFAVFLVFLSVGAALLIGKALGPIAGFCIVAVVYLIIAVILWSLKARIIENLEVRLSVMMKKKNNDV